MNCGTLVEVPVRRHAVSGLEDAGEVEGGEGSGAGDLVDVEVAGEVLLEEGSDLVGAFADVAALDVAVSKIPNTVRPPSLLGSYAWSTGRRLWSLPFFPEGRSRSYPEGPMARPGRPA